MKEKKSNFRQVLSGAEEGEKCLPCSREEKNIEKVKFITSCVPRQPVWFGNSLSRSCQYIGIFFIQGAKAASSVLSLLAGFSSKANILF
jgi:hypothetical protein